jgi:hypothetical protein
VHKAVVPSMACAADAPTVAVPSDAPSTIRSYVPLRSELEPR